MKTIKVIIEKNYEESNFWARIEGDFGIVVAHGDKRDELEANIKSAFDYHLELDDKLKQEFSQGYKFEFVYDLESAFSLYDEIKISKLAKKANINASLLRQYAKGLAKASEKRKMEIEKAFHDLGRELLNIKL